MRPCVGETKEIAIELKVHQPLGSGYSYCTPSATGSDNGFQTFLLHVLRFNG